MSLAEAYDERAQTFWSIYVNEAEQHDTNITETWKSDMDSTLIFVRSQPAILPFEKLNYEFQAGLFSATLTAFIIESYKLLKVDSGDATNALLTQMLAIQIVGASLNTSAIPLPTAIPIATTFKPSASAIAVNILWFLSLTCSLAAALCITLVQQWIRRYLQRIQRTNQPQRRATIRGIMSSGSEKWKMNDVVEYIPTLLHLSLFLFFAGLCTFLWSVNTPTAGAVVVIVVFCLAFYGLATVAPLIDPSAPYETPFSSILWHVIPRRSDTGKSLSDDRERLASPPPQGKSLSDVRERLASPHDRQPLHRLIQAISWVYDRTTDDLELQELVRSIPGLLSAQDGQIAWREFLLKSRSTADALEARINRLLKGCSASGYLDRKNRQLRATLCIDALLAILKTTELLSSSYPTIKRDYKSSPSHTTELNDIIRARWDDEGILATKSVCAETLFSRRARLYWIFSMRQNHSQSGFRDLSARADQALADIDEMRQALERVLQEPESSLRTHRGDVETLLRLYFIVVESKGWVLNEWFEKMQQVLPEGQHFPLLSWYYSLPSDGLRISYAELLSPEKIELKLRPYQILAYLRLHGAYPSLSDVSSPTLSPTWFPLLQDVPLRRHLNTATRTFRPFHQGNITIANYLFMKGAQTMNPIDPESPVYGHLCRELQPISSLLDILEPGPATSVTVNVKMASQEPQEYVLHGLTSLITQIEGPFSSLASVLEAIIEDEGMIGGLVELTTTIESYKATPLSKTTAPAFKSSVINQWLELICPALRNGSPALSKGSQVLLVGALREILDWEREAPAGTHPPLSGADVERLLDLLNNLTHELPVEMAERALGTTLSTSVLGIPSMSTGPNASGPSSPSMHERASCVYAHVLAQRSRAASPPQSPINLVN
ncbi:hypothetical protein DXG01_011227 [Tephrocybe rancida]|nr:hypothetical protein DXG01_011227 [Tephrocybe rancida]